MPFVTTAIRLYGKPVVDAGSFRAEVAAYNAENPASAIPTAAFEGKANSFRWTTGRTPGRGWILMLWKDMSELDLSQPVLLEFEVEGQIVALANLVILHAVKIAGHTDDPNAVYLIELTDRRYHARRCAFDQQFNVLTPENNLYASTTQPSVTIGGFSAPHDWVTMTEAVWQQMPPLGAFPGFPPTFVLPGNEPPINFRWPCESPYEALDVILKQLDCVLNYDPIKDVFTIAEHGSGNDLAALDLTLGTWDKFMSDAQPKENLAAKVADTVHVCFHSRNWFYGDDKTIPTSQDAWQTRPTYSIDVATGQGGSGTKEILWDDLPALWDIDGNLINYGQLQARADRRAATYIQSRLIGGLRFRRVYSGLCNGDFRTSGVLSGVAYHEFSDGVKTTILRTPREVTDHDTDWDNPSLITLEEETSAPPDIARPTIPFQRFAWVKLLKDIPAGKCNLAVVLRATPDFGEGCGLQPVKWIPCRTPQGDLIIPIFEVTGQQSYARDQIVCVWYHWQSYRWTILGGAGGGMGGWWSRLAARSGQAHTHIEVVRPGMGCEWVDVPEPPGIRGILNAFEINCSSHNSQGPIHNLIVRMFGPFFDAETGEVFYLFDYAGTNELDIERYPFSP